MPIAELIKSQGEVLGFPSYKGLESPKGIQFQLSPMDQEAYEGQRITCTVVKTNSKSKHLDGSWQWCGIVKTDDTSREYMTLTVSVDARAGATYV